MRLLARVLLSLVMLSTAALAQQDQSATLVADAIDYSSDTATLVATGNVEILQNGVRLRAQQISYDGENDLLQIIGPIYVKDADGTTIFANFGELSGDLQNGVLTQARLVYARQLQLAANEIRRTGGRYTQFYKTVASSCHVCESDPTPLWEIRAKRITHDAEERQLYFENATLRVLGAPVFYTPYLRLPDPTVERASGFLFPELRSNGDLGLGIRTPYFFTLGDHADLTLTPWVTTKGSRTLEGRYRRKFSFGEIEANGAVTEDNLGVQNIRSYLFVDGSFVLPKNFKATFDIELVSDPGYLLQYGYSDKDRLDSAINISRARRDQLISFDLVHYRSLRTSVDNRTVPTIVGDVVYKRRFEPSLIGGLASFELEAYGHRRRASFDATNTGLARDIARLSGVANWRRDWVMSNGMLFATETELRVDSYQVIQDERVAFDDTTEVTPYAALEWRWPMLRQTANATHVLEPVVQVVWSQDKTRPVDNEDSVLVEFDEANLFRFSRFPGVDAQEAGARLNIGVTYTREDPDGWSLGLTVGRVLRDEARTQFPDSTGLNGRGSDWLLAAQLKIGERFDLINRAILDDQLSIARNEMRLNWSGDKFNLGSSFVWLEADTAVGRPTDTSEIAFDGAYRVSRHWTLSSDLRYDFAQDRTTRAGIGLSYQNECARVDLSLSRRFTSSSIVTPTTDFSLSVQLAGFGARGIGGESFARQCNG